MAILSARRLIVASLALVGIHAATPAPAQSIDPALARSWEFAQKSIPGMPYDLIKAACAEGALTIYAGTWTDAQQNQIDHFKQRFACVKVQMFVLQTGARRERYLSETRAGRFIDDIVQESDPGALNKMVSDGLLMNYAVTSDKSYADALKHTGYWYPLQFSLNSIAWNTNLVSPEQAKKLADWKGMADPVFAGRAAAVDAAGGGSLMLPYYAWRKLYGDDFIRQLGALKPRVFTSTDLAAAAMASGDIALIFGAPETSLPPLLAAGAPIQWIFPDPAIGAPTGQGIAAHAPHPNAAKLYQEYAFSEEGYGYWQLLAGPPARIGFKDERPIAKQPWYKIPANIFSYDPADATASTGQIVDMFHKLIGTTH